jgi:hypothetical protein
VARCIKHNFDDAVGSCRTCANEFCRQCLVFPHGSKKPPLCVECALARAGVRTQAVQRSVIQRRTYEASERERAAALRRNETTPSSARRAREAEGTIDLDKVDAVDSRHPAMAGKVRLLLLLVVVALAGVVGLVQFSA